MMDLTTTVICTNCGDEKLASDSTYCRRIDNCVHSQNSFIMDCYTTEELKVILAKESRVFRSDPRPLCYKCAGQDNYTCVHCELQLHKEGIL